MDTNQYATWIIQDLFNFKTIEEALEKYNIPKKNILQALKKLKLSTIDKAGFLLSKQHANRDIFEHEIVKTSVIISFFKVQREMAKQKKKPVSWRKFKRDCKRYGFAFFPFS